MELIIIWICDFAIWEFESNFRSTYPFYYYSFVFTLNSLFLK